MTIRNTESVPSEAGPDLDGIEQGISNNESGRARMIGVVSWAGISEGGFGRWQIRKPAP